MKTDWKDHARDIPRNILLISLGCFLSALAINSILIPHRFVSGGIMGLALLLSYQFPIMPFSWYYLLLNIPVFLMAYLFVGRRFFVYSLVGLSIFTLAVSTVHIPFLDVQNKILCALAAGVLSGAGIGTILRSFGSSGGSDVLSVIMFKRFSIRPGTTIFTMNALVVVLTLATNTLETVLYTLIFLHVNSRVINMVLTGLSQRKAAIVVSRHWYAIAKAIRAELDRNVTFLQGSPHGDHAERPVLYVVVTIRDVGRLKSLIHHIDPAAFVVVHETQEVMARRIGNQPHW
jgi:uncharacterized membrane-anchored protein YitT (DUF2179 family)